jgi:hypothetical protein
VVLVVGISTSIRTQTGRIVLSIGVIFLALALIFQGIETRELQSVYAMLYPWGENFRLLHLVSICASLLTGLGVVEITKWLRRPGRQRLTRIGLVLAVAYLQLTVVFLAMSLADETRYYKAGANILVYRLLTLDNPQARGKVWSAIGHLDDDLDAQATACALGVRYVYIGAAGPKDEQRAFPTAAELEQLHALDEVFSSGKAAIFQLSCPSPDYSPVLT